MESKGWIFSWNDKFVFRPKGHCADVPINSYCGFKFPGHGDITYKFSSSGSGNLTYGNGENGGWVRIYLNDVEIASKGAKGTANVEFDYSEGDILKIWELNAIINIHSLCADFTGSYFEVLIFLVSD